MAHITTESDEMPIIRFLYNLGVQDCKLLGGEDIFSKDSFLVFLNGGILGVVKNYRNLIRIVRLVRRMGKISPFVSIYPNLLHQCVYISSDGGRLCRPYIIVEKGTPLVTTEHMNELKHGVRKFNDFLDDGLIEYLDVNEESDALIACSEKEIEKDTTHLEIAPFTLLGKCHFAGHIQG